MFSVGKILVLVDGSPPSIAALEHAVAIAADSDATVDVLRVDTARPEGAIASPSSEAIRDELLAAAATALERAEARLDGRLVRRTAMASDPIQTIIEIANDGAYDLIVMGTHGRVGRLHAMIGSVAEGVIRNAPCPVLTIREPGGAEQSFAERRHGEPTVAERLERRHS